MKRIGVLTSGGDAPGMNAAVRAVVRAGLHKGWEVFGVRHGYAGLVAGAIEALTARDVGRIIQRGGTMLGSARCPEFATEKTRRTALAALERHHIGALVVVGGNESQACAQALGEMGLPVVGVASTIDNDLYGSDITRVLLHGSGAVERDADLVRRPRRARGRHATILCRPRSPGGGRLAGSSPRVFPTGHS
jgi:6-phosphofructokinase 1